MRLRMIVPVALVLVSIQGCIGFTCTDLGIFAIVVQVQDAETGGRIASTPIGIFAYGENRDTVYGGRNHDLAGPIEAGTYDVEVRAEGYQVWRRENVTVVEAGRCSEVQTVELIAEMVRSASDG